MTLIQKIQHHHQDEKIISTSIRQITYEEHTLLVISHPRCHAAISLQGAHLLYWQPTAENSPIIWLSDKALFKKGTAIRGGVPICWPWFGKGGEPMHGFARIIDWQLQSHTENSDGVNLVLSLKESELTKKLWPHPFNLMLTLHIGSDCQIELSCKGDYQATSALHSYFSVNDITTTVVKGLGDKYDERLSTINQPKKIGEITFNQEVDRLYTSPEPVVTIEDGQRKIQVTNYNSSDIVTWNGWIEKTKATADLADESYKEFVCVETCRVSKPIVSTATEKTTYGMKIAIIK